jgi:hypothetical protein
MPHVRYCTDMPESLGVMVTLSSGKFKSLLRHMVVYLGQRNKLSLRNNVNGN